ncbi:MAG: amidase family protein [Hyphomicrobiales bacterium]
MTQLWELSATALARLMRNKETSAVEVTTSALERLDAVNPAINAVVQFMPDEALATAQAVDDRIARGKEIGPLAGVPITIKVNVDQKGYATTNGLRIQKDLIPEENSPVVDKLLDADAICVGRTNTPAFSLHWFTRNSLHGHTLNPHNTGLTPGGSSGGAAAATAAGIGAIGHGSDIAGSVRYPAYACGIHGLRPSLGRVPAANLSVPDRYIGGQVMAVSGPLARSIDDIELAFHAMSGADARDPWSSPIPLALHDVPKKVALCVDPDGMQVDAEVENALRETARILQDAGYQVDELACPDMRESASLQAVLWLAEFRRTSAAAVVNEDDPDATFVYAQMARLCPEPNLNAFLDALQRRITLARAWLTFFEDYPLVLCPVSGEAPFPDLLDLESPEAFDRVIAAQLPQIGPPFLGLPGLSVATGILENSTPMGVQLLSAPYREDILIAAGKAIQAACPAIDPVTPS